MSGQCVRGRPAHPKQELHIKLYKCTSNRRNRRNRRNRASGAEPHPQRRAEGRGAVLAPLRPKPARGQGQHTHIYTYIRRGRSTLAQRWQEYTV